MKKTIVLIIFICMAAFAQTAVTWPSEQCHTINDPGYPKECVQTGYICHLTADVSPLSDAFAFFLGFDASCDASNFYKSDAFPTVFRLSKIENGSVNNIETPSLQTKFFMVNDSYSAGALSLTMAGSFALSAFNNSTKVAVAYRMGPNDTEWGGVRVKNITLMK